jgi:LmbE family N-acetylglucosaminyl deacetylase
VYAHPDDADVAAGGTLARWSTLGCEVHLVVVCQGDKGAHDSHEGGEQLVERRRGEVERAAKHLGVSSVVTWNVPDGEVSNDLSTRERLVEVVRRWRPDVVLGPDPSAVFFGGVYVNHRDHRETGWALLDAVAPAAAMPLYFPGTGPAHAVRYLLLSGTHEPDVAVDISSSIEAKIAAVLEHRSQMGEASAEISEVVKARAQQGARDLGAGFIETFRRVQLAE